LTIKKRHPKIPSRNNIRHSQQAQDITKVKALWLIVNIKEKNVKSDGEDQQVLHASETTRDVRKFRFFIQTNKPENPRNPAFESRQT